MNDPQVDGRIKAEERAYNSEHGLDEEWDQEHTLLNPSRWWFASTACPLIAGTMGPIANAFNIAAIVQSWREYVPYGGIQGGGTMVHDPGWLIGLNGLSLLFAVLANGSLMLNMVGRVKFTMAHPVTIIGFFMASFILIALVIVANTSAFDFPHPQDSYPSLTHPYYFACFAGGMYFLIGLLMVFTVWGALMKKYEKSFSLNTSQRTLMMQTITLMVYFLAGAGIYSKLEGWRYGDALYWADFTLLTIGIGDNFVPKTVAGQALIIPYTFGGILAVGLVISSIRSLLLDKGSTKLHARTTEKKRAHVATIEDAEWGHGTAFSFLNPRIRKNKKQPMKFANERDRRYAEFHAMRMIQERTVIVNRYRALSISASMFFILWLVGALVFWECERVLQGWTYFQSLYFAWVMLITLGYGDFQPLSNAGKAFFVLWSLLAIPTLTVLISDLSDTVVKAVSEATNWIGSLAILPGDSDFFATVRKNVNRLSGGFLFKKYGPEVREVEEERERELNKGRVGTIPRILEDRMFDEEKEALDKWCSENKENDKDKDLYFYHFLLIKEIRTLLIDSQLPTPKKYTYDEWAYYLKLLGHDEEDPAFHTTHHNQPRKDDESGPQVGRILDHDGNPRAWSWLSLRSPLLGLGTEADWLAERMLSKLQAELHFVGKPGRGRSDAPPPFSITAIRAGASADEINKRGEKIGLSGEALKKKEATFY